MRLTPKEREELQRERRNLSKCIAASKDMIEIYGSGIAEIDAKLAEPEVWVPGNRENYECIVSHGSIITDVCVNAALDKDRIAFNNYFKPGTGQAEAVRDVEGPMRAIWKTAWELGLNAYNIVETIVSDSTKISLMCKQKELSRLCSTHIETVRNWKGKS